MLAGHPHCSATRSGKRKHVNTSILSVIAVLFATALVAVLTGCTGGNTNPAQGSNEPTNVLTPRGWEMVWSDEFEGSSLDTGNWNYQTGDGTAEGIPGWGNNELQYYQEDNVSLSGGSLVITARQETVGEHQYTSARINTDGKVGIKYGRIEARIHAAPGQGLWSAFWMLPTNSAYGGWAAGGEIDIMEVFSRTPQPFTQAAVHYGMAWPLNAFVYQKYEGIDPADGFHVYALEWDEAQLRWYVDGQHYYTVNRSTYWNYYKDQATNAHMEGPDSAPFDQPFHLLLNVAVGGTLPGDPDPSALPSEMRVDYVRVYSCNINPDTGVGCDGFADFTDPSVVPPLGGGVFKAEYDLYVDAPETLSFEGIDETVPLSIGVWDNNGAAVVTEMESGDRGMVIDMNTSAGGNFNIFPTSNARQNLFGMGSASDGANYAGELKFDLFINSEQTDPESGIQIKMDSGFPDLGFVELAVADLPQDEWSTVTVQISDIAHNPGSFGGGPVDLSMVLSLFVLEPTSSAHLQVDNVRLVCGHVMECGITPPQPPPPAAQDPQLVYIDTVDPAWDAGITAADSGSNWTDYNDPANPDNKVQWRELDDAERGTILEVSFSDSDAFGVWFFKSSMGVDLTAYAPGSLIFDIKVDNYGANEQGMTMKVDCFFPCTSGDQLIGKVGDGDWETVAIPVSQLLTGGVNLSTVNTGLVVFPTDQSSAQTFHIDNVQWVPGEAPDPGGGGGDGSAAPIVVYDNQLAEGWNLWDCCGGAVLGEVEDDEDHGRVVELTFAETPTVAGFQSATGVDASGLAGGTLEFEFKQVAPPPEGAVWLLKLESSGAGTAKEVELASLGNPAPNDTWQKYSYTLSEDLAGLDISDLALIMIFPNWGMANGAIGRIDNVSLQPASQPQADTAVIFGDAIADGWFLWDCCGAGEFSEEDDDEDHGKVIELRFGPGGTVTGLNATAPVDASAYAAGALTFEFKQVSPPPDGSEWRLKLESADAATFVDIAMTEGGNPMPNSDWQQYRFGFDTELAALDVSNLKLILFFPLWEQAEGAVGRIDNVHLEPTK